MKIIDLLNKIANGEVPKKIKYSSYIFKYTGDKRIQRLYVMENQENYLLRDFVAQLNSEVEIIEEEPRDIEVCGTLFTKSEYDKLANNKEDKKIEPIEWNTDDDNCQIYFNGAMNYVSRAELELALKINEIIEELNRRE